MTKARVSIGTGTPTGKPASGPEGPYVTDDHDDEVAAAKRRSPDEVGHEPVAPQPAEERQPRQKGSSQP